MCAICQDTGYVMQDVGTATTPDYESIPCRCNPAPLDADDPDNEPDADWETNNRFNDARYEGI